MNDESYPLGESSKVEIRAYSGRPVAALTVEGVAESQYVSEDLRIGRETLLIQAVISRKAGFRQLAQNLSRAAELTVVPDRELLEMYEKLRPGRSTLDEMLEVAEKLESSYGATINAAHVREAAAVYLQRGMLRK